MTPRFRKRGYALVALAFLAATAASAAVKARALGVPFDLAVSDGRFYYAYLPTAVIDRDLDFDNQIREHWANDFSPGLLEARTPTGLVRNKYSIGFALTLLPAFLVGHGVALASGGAIPADGYSWPYQFACLALVEFLFFRMLVRTDQFASRHGIGSTPTFLGVLALALATPWVYYAGREPFMVHAVSAFWCTEVAALAMMPGSPRRFWAKLGFCAAMAVVCRPTNVHLAPLILLGIRRLGTLRGIGFASIGVIPIALQMLTWKELNGSYISYSYGDEGFDWTHPKLYETLFSDRHGLFFWSPLLLLVVVGWWHLEKSSLTRAWLLGAGLLWYANSAWHCWWFGDAFGGRAFLELSGLFGLGLAAAFARMSRRWVIALVIVATLANIALAVLYITHRIPRGDPLF